jgi:undecaprenyl-diphosphatase
MFAQTLKQWDSDLFLLLNGLHSPFFDFIMYWTSEKTTWIPVYLILIYLIIRKYKNEAMLFIPLALVMILFSDQSSVLLKSLTHRLRPCHEPALEGLIHLVKNKCGGDFGFVSSHAANHFALSSLLILAFGNYRTTGGAILLLWAVLISYSRIYLGVHYPLDVLAGGLLGIFRGFLFYYLCLLSKRLFIRSRISQRK